jgi:hypothetical protein
MVGMKRLDNLHECCSLVIRNSIPGDFVETGIWRGGCGILMRGVLKALDDKTRTVWLFDSFEGLPKPDAPSFPKENTTDPHWTFTPYLGISLENVKGNFAKYELLDERVRFVKGWFRDTIPGADVSNISVLRLDGDMYESTWLALINLYPKISPGGFVIIDDYGAVPSCKVAVNDFRAKHSITAPIFKIDWTGIFWRK